MHGQHGTTHACNLECDEDYGYGEFETNEMRMLRWMCGVTKKIKSKTNV